MVIRDSNPARPASVNALPPGHGVYLCCVTRPVEDVDGCPNCGNHDSYRFIPDKPR